MSRKLLNNSNWCAIFGFLLFVVKIETSIGAPTITATNETKCDGEVGEILNNLRVLMQKNNIQAYLIPMTDAHSSEYIANHDKRLEFITKFTGSAGNGVVTLEEAALWTDSRYHLQAEREMNLGCWSVMKQGLSNVPSISDWLVNSLPANASVGVDPFLISASEFRQKKSDLNAKGHELLSIPDNLVNAVWINQPARSTDPVIPLDIQYSGKSANSKIHQVMEAIENAGAESIVITALDDIAWLLNLRGSDIEYNPLFFSYAILTPVTSYLFVDKSKIESESVNRHFESEMINLVVRGYDDVLAGAKEVVNSTKGKIVLSTAVNQAIADTIPSERQILSNIVSSIKIVKNAVEAVNMDHAHIRDGLALVKYLHWLNDNIDSINITELSGATKLTEFRSQQDKYRGLSFEVISAVGEHAAMAHYSPTVETAKRITRDDLYLVDSGGQYWDGTTDVTRTMHFGTPTQEEKDCYTRVLKGFIGFATSHFPKTTPISYLDYMARRPLWQAGLDYGHGTGHGVGMYLSVHEYPPLIGSKSTDTLKANIFTSDEPGYYKDNHFGIRIEDVVQVIESENTAAFGGKGAFTFHSITYAPIATNLVDKQLLTKEELDYLNEYNQRVLDTLAPMLLKYRDMGAYQWLVNETKALV